MRPAALLIIPSAFAFASAALAETTYTMSTGTTTFLSIQGVGTPVTLSNADDGSGAIPAGVAFPFFDTAVTASTMLYVSSNGVLNILTNDHTAGNVAIPSTAVPNAFIAPFWDDLIVPTTGGVYSAVIALNPRVLVVEWSGVHNYNATADAVSFQVRIEEGTGRIQLAYGPRTGGTAWSGTIGIENETGTVAPRTDAPSRRAARSPTSLRA
jgi:hypothetical protein